mgnify:CR=1 FL=1
MHVRLVTLVRGIKVQLSTLSYGLSFLSYGLSFVSFAEDKWPQYNFQYTSKEQSPEGKSTLSIKALKIKPIFRMSVFFSYDFR